MEERMSGGIAIDIDYDLFDKIIAGFDFEGKDKSLNHYEVCKRIYESTYMYCKFAVVEEKHLREKYEKKVVEKVGLIIELEATIKAYEEKFGKIDLGKQVPEEGESEAQETAEVLPLHEGSEGDKRDSGPRGVY